MSDFKAERQGGVGRGRGDIPLRATTLHSNNSSYQQKAPTQNIPNRPIGPHWIPTGEGEIDLTHFQKSGLKRIDRTETTPPPKKHQLTFYFGTRALGERQPMKDCSGEIEGGAELTVKRILGEVDEIGRIPAAAREEMGHLFLLKE